MATTRYTLNRQTVFQSTRQLLKATLEFHDTGRSCSADRLLMLLLLAASRRISLSQACALVVACCCYETARKALQGQLSDAADLENRLNKTLVSQLPHNLSRRKQYLAIDLVLTPYYGQPLQDPNEIRAGKSKNGTNRFHAYATLYVSCRGERFTIAMTSVQRKEPLVDVVKRLLQRAAGLGVKPCLLLLDRSFWCVDVMRYLMCARVPFLIPVVRRGKKPTRRQKATGTYEFYARKRSGFDRYTLTSHRGGKTATVDICVCRVRKENHGRESARGKTLVYAFWGVQPPSWLWVKETYRRRFGIETSYRQANQSCLRTSTRCPLIRLLRVGLSLILRNVWIWLHYQVLSTPRRGGRKLQPNRLRYGMFLTWLMTFVIEHFKLLDRILIERQNCGTLTLPAAES